MTGRVVLGKVERYAGLFQKPLRGFRWVGGTGVAGGAHHSLQAWGELYHSTNKIQVKPHNSSSVC
jgi:hypothetical protein